MHIYIYIYIYTLPKNAPFHRWYQYNCQDFYSRHAWARAMEGLGHKKGVPKVLSTRFKTNLFAGWFITFSTWLFICPYFDLDRWYKYHSQMGGLWHWFTHIWLPFDQSGALGHLGQTSKDYGPYSACIGVESRDSDGARPSFGDRQPRGFAVWNIIYIHDGFCIC